MAAQDDFEVSAYREYAPAIGWLCMQWALLETVFDRHLLRVLIPLEPSDVCNAVASAIDFRAKIQIALNVGLVVSLDRAWYDELAAVLGDVDENLRLKRNRIVHGAIVTQLAAPYPTVRVDAKPKRKKAQAHQPLRLSTYDEVPVSPDDIWTTAEEIGAATQKIGRLAGRLRDELRKASPRKST
jgi:hypothetical protein